MNLLSLYLIITIFIRNPQSNNQSLFQGSLPIVLFAPGASGIPNCDNPQRRLKIILFKKEGVRGMLPACCLPNGGERGLLS
jgi:hypothetical protein